MRDRTAGGGDRDEQRRRLDAIYRAAQYAPDAPFGGRAYSETLSALEEQRRRPSHRQPTARQIRRAIAEAEAARAERRVPIVPIWVKPSRQTPDERRRSNALLTVAAAAAGLCLMTATAYAGVLPDTAQSIMHHVVGGPAVHHHGSVQTPATSSSPADEVVVPPAGDVASTHATTPPGAAQQRAPRKPARPTPTPTPTPAPSVQGSTTMAPAPTTAAPVPPPGTSPAATLPNGKPRPGHGRH